jgi:hypothetical protein
MVSVAGALAAPLAAGAPDFSLDRTAGSHALAAAGQRERWADNRRTGT